MIYHSFFSSIVFLIFFKNKIEFNLHQNYLHIILLTATALAGQYFNSESYKYAKTNRVVILSYSRIIFSTLLGFLFIGEKISMTTVLGILIIVITTYFVKKKSRFFKGKETDFHHLFYLYDLKFRSITLP